jgi:hypothetical protein
MRKDTAYFIIRTLRSTPFERKVSEFLVDFVLCRLSCDKIENYCFKLMMKYGSVFERIDCALRFRVGAM